MLRPALAAAVVLLFGAVWVEVFGAGPGEPYPLDSRELRWDGWKLVVLWAAAAAVLLARGRVLARLAGAFALWLAGLAAFFV